MHPEHQASNIASWKHLELFIESTPESCDPWKKAARAFVDECVKLGLNNYFRAGTSLRQIIFSTLDHHGLNGEPRVTVDFMPNNAVRVGYGSANLHPELAEVDYELPFDLAFPTFRRFLNQLWMNTMPEAIPASIRSPIAPLTAPVLTSRDHSSRE